MWRVQRGFSLIWLSVIWSYSSIHVSKNIASHMIQIRRKMEFALRFKERKSYRNLRTILGEQQCRFSMDSCCMN